MRMRCPPARIIGRCQPPAMEKPSAVSSIEALQYHEIGVERGVAAGIVGLGHQVRIEQGENDGALIALFLQPEGSGTGSYGPT